MRDLYLSRGLVGIFMVLNLSQRSLPSTSKWNFFFGTLCVLLVATQLWFLVYPTDIVWYTPAVLFYLKAGSGFMGLGTFLVLTTYQRSYFLPHHHLGSTLILAACLGYAITGFGAEFVAISDKPQAYIERAEILFWMAGAFFGVLKVALPYSNALHNIIRTACVLGIALLTYTVLAPISWLHLPEFSLAVRIGICLTTAICWVIAGCLYLQLDEKDSLILDPVIGYSLILAGVMAGMHAFAPWHPLWTIWQYVTALSYFAATLAFTLLQSRRRRFQIKPFFLVAFSTLLIPFITLTSGLAGFGAWRFGANALSINSAAKTQAIQAEFTQPPGQRHAYINLDILTYASASQLLLSLDQLPASISRSDVTNTTYDDPISVVSRTLHPGQQPSYHLIHIVPLEVDLGLAGSIAVVSEVLPNMHSNVARVRLLAMSFVFLAASGIFYGLWRIIQRADQRILAQRRSLQSTVADLKEAEQGREDLTNMIVHDLRSPLSAIHTSLQLLERTAGTDLSERQTRPLTRALDASVNMSKMISDMLNVSKLERGQLELLHSDVHVQDLLSDRIYTFEAQAQKAGKQLRQICDITAEHDSVYADGDLIRRVLDNLISNALRYTRCNGTITITATAQANQMQFQVADTGAGISPEQLPNVFKKFSQVSTDDIQRRKGLGLGLAFCKLAVEAHGGRIWVNSIMDVGTTFTFTIPYQPLDLELITPSKAPQPCTDTKDQLPPISFDDRPSRLQ